MAVLPKWGMLIAGISSFAGAGQAVAITVQRPADSTPLHSPSVFGEVKLLFDGEKIYLSEQCKPFDELDLGDTLESKRLRALLNRLMPEGGTVTLPLGPSVVADGGAMGSWSRPQHQKGTRKDGE